jgi:hypothetical protein
MILAQIDQIRGKKIIFILIFVFILSCKKKVEKRKKEDKTVIKSLRDTIGNYNKSIKLIRTKKINNDFFKEKIENIISIKSIDFNSDNIEDFIIEAVNKKDGSINEYWYDSSYKFIFKDKFDYSINEICVLDINKDGKNEVMRCQGYEDGVNFSISEFSETKLDKRFFFIPIVEDATYDGKIFYSTDLDDLRFLAICDDRIKVSFDKLNLDFEVKKLKNQNKLPVLFFQSNIDKKGNVEYVSKLNNIKCYSYSELLKKCNTPDGVRMLRNR